MLQCSPSAYVRNTLCSPYSVLIGPWQPRSWQYMDLMQVLEQIQSHSDVQYSSTR